MGCDIHGYLEEIVETTTTLHKQGKQPRVRSEVRVRRVACPDISRDYLLFSLLAGVRNYRGVEPVVQPRGIPENLSRDVLREYCLQIDDEKARLQEKDALPRWDNGDYCTEKEAKFYVEQYGCALVEARYGDRTERYVVNPDWHTPSWLTVEELEEVQRRYAAFEENGEPVGPNRDLGIIIAMMNAMKGEETRRYQWFDDLVEVTTTKYTPRFVFWFDN